MKQITPFLWFDNQAEEAVNYYISLFKDSKIGQVARYGKEGPGPEGQVMTMSFSLNGQSFTALNGGPQFKFTEAVSFVVNCENQEEVDHYWEGLSAGGEKSQCGWLKDKWGLSWQVVPNALIELLQSSNKEQKSKVMQAMMQMTKLDIAQLKAAAGQD